MNEHRPAGRVRERDLRYEAAKAVAAQAKQTNDDRGEDAERHAAFGDQGRHTAYDGTAAAVNRHIPLLLIKCEQI